MPDGVDDELMRRLHARAEEMKHSGASPTLMVQLLSDLSILGDRLTNADRQRIEITKKLDTVLDNQTKVTILGEDVRRNMQRLDSLEMREGANTEFRLRFLGGSVVAKLLYAGLGGLLVAVVQYFLEKR